jgi:P-type Cu+ transporter
MQKTETKKPKTQCYHCGDDCNEIVEVDKHIFCCHGCKTVYELLRDHEMGLYYQLSEKPGSKQNSASKDFSYLDEAKIRSHFVEFEEDNTTIVRLALPSIHCSSCIWLLENLPKLEKGIDFIKVDFSGRTATIHFKNQELKLSALAHLLTKIGYTPDLSLDSSENKQKKVDRSLTIKIGVAGFAFGNSMLMALPEYFDWDDAQLQGFLPFFRIILLGFSLPVVTYAGADYFISAFKSLKKGFINIDTPIALGIAALFLRSVWEISTGIGSGYFDSLNGLVFFLLLGKLFQRKTYDSFRFDRDYTSFFPLSANTLHSGKEVAVPVRELAKGDRIIVRYGELIPTDSLLIRGFGLIDNSFATGESEPITKKEGDKIFAGAKQKGGAIELEVLKPMDQSRLTRLWNNPLYQKEEGAHFQNITDKISQHFTMIILLIALLSGIYWYNVDPTQIWKVITAVLIVACPCALALSAPFTFGNTLRIFGRNHFYLKNTDTIENLAHSKHLVLDKTGTLTESVGGEVHFSGVLDLKVKSAIKSLTYQSGHPLSRIISKAMGSSKGPEIEFFKEQEGAGIEAQIEGELYRLGSADFVGVKEIDRKKESSVYLGVNGAFLGSFHIKSKFRDGLQAFAEEMNSLKWQMSILSGDNNKDQAKLSEIFGEDLEVLFEQKPIDKLNYIRQKQKDGYACVMLGDGLNDAGALSESSVGIGIMEEINAFTPASDAILHAQTISKLPKFIEMSKASIRIVWMSFVLSFAYNSIGLYFAISGQLSPVLSAILMPLSSISVVLFVSLKTNLKAKKLGL